MAELSDEQLLRYSRQIMLPEIDAAGQQKLLASKVLIIGAGGLGSAAAMYLATAGIGRIVIADDDVVELSNLQRQLLHRQEDLGLPKADSANATLRALNPDIDIAAIKERLQGERLEQEVSRADVVVDGSDNFATRFAVNKACIQHTKPLVSGAAIRAEGQLSVYRSDLADSPCYRCLYADIEAQEDQNCSENGVLSPVVGIIGSLQALEAIKVLLNIGDTLCGRLLLFDGMALEWRSIKLKRDPNCPDCSQIGPA